jgi:hypothetical protein
MIFLQTDKLQKIKRNFYEIYLGVMWKMVGSTSNFLPYNHSLKRTILNTLIERKLSKELMLTRKLAHI